MSCNICGQVFTNRFQLGPHKRKCAADHKRRCVRVQGCCDNEPDIISTPEQVVRQTPEQVCLRTCANRERDWAESTRALFASRPPATPNSMARDYRPVSSSILYMILDHLLILGILIIYTFALICCTRAHLLWA